MVKVRMETNVTKPLNKRICIAGTRDEAFWIEFKYEKLPLICFYCRTIGHDNKSCFLKFKDEYFDHRIFHDGCVYLA